MTGFGSLIGWVLGLQREVYAALGAQIQGLSESPKAALSAVVFALILGMVHAMTPGHGKAVVFAYFLGKQARPWSGVLMALTLAGTHVLSAIVLVAVLGSAATAFGRSAGLATGVQVASYAMILVLGAWLLYRSIAETLRPPAAAQELHHRMAGGLLPFAVGLLPCPMTMLILTYAIAHATLAIGLALTAIMGVGVAVTIAAVGTVGIVTRRSIFSWLDPHGRGYTWVLNGLQIASSLAILFLGAVFLAGSLA